MNSYPSTAGASGAVASLPYSTSTVVISFPSLSKNLTLYFLTSYIGATVKSSVTLLKSLSQPLNSYPSTAGASGAVAAASLSTVTFDNSFPSLSTNVTVNDTLSSP